MASNRNQDRNRELLGQLKKYLPEGSIQDQGHIPVKGEGCWYQDANGMNYLDFSSGIFTNSFGHGCEEINQAAYLQAGRLANIHGRHCEAELCFYQRLFPLLPADDYKAIPYNDGGYAIDRGITDIVNYHGRERIAIGAFRNGFHGKTQGTKLLINETKHASFYDNFQMDFPNCYRCPWNRQRGHCDMECAKSSFRKLEEKQARAIIFEPVQGFGIIVPPDGYWKVMQNYCRHHGILMFADEVLTGGGRTGDYLASAGFGIVPDMIALTKGLANGKPLSVLLERDFMTHNPYAVRPLERASTFAAHPEALAAAAKALELLERRKVLENVRIRGKELKEKLLDIAESFRSVGEIRCLGLMAAIEFVEDRKSRKPFPKMGNAVFQTCRKNGLEVIDSGHILRIAPPLIVGEEELALGMEIIRKSIAQTEDK